MVRAAVLGFPAKHSLSPAIHNAAYAALGMEWTYEAIDVEPGTFVHTVRGLFDSDYVGLNITMPFKSEAYSYAHHLSGPAQRLGSVNTLVKQNDLIHGYNTDGEGFTLSLAEARISIPGTKILVIGAGGASTAICDALVERGAHVTVTARDTNKAYEVTKVAQHPGGGSIRVVDFTVRHQTASEVDIIVNATPVGMTIDGQSSVDVPLDASVLDPRHVVVDTIYHPLETELLRQAREIGCSVMNGTEMLLHQAALSFTLMTQREVPLQSMRTALKEQLAHRGE